MRRILEAELLDHLDPKDPEAIWSRRDLRRLDHLLGNSRWILRSIRRTAHDALSVVELGAGEGYLCRRIRQAQPDISVTGLDLIGAPEDLPGGIAWVRGDFLKTLCGINAEICCGSLILHHLDEGALRCLGAEFGRFTRLFFSEPLRALMPLRLAKLAAPFVGKITRHDMPASIRAGFRRGELASMLGLNTKEWSIREEITLRGTLRFAAIRK